MKVLENRIIALDILPGTDEITARRELRSSIAGSRQGSQAILGGGGETDDGDDDTEISGAAAAICKAANEKGTAVKGILLPEEGEGKRGVAKIVDGAGNVVGTLGGGLFGVLKGVGETGVDTVSTLGVGLGKTGQSLATGLLNTGKAAFTGGGNAKEGTQKAVQKPKEKESKAGEAKPAEVKQGPSVDAGPADAEDAENSDGKKGPRKIEVRNQGKQE